MRCFFLGNEGLTESAGEVKNRHVKSSLAACLQNKCLDFHQPFRGSLICFFFFLCSDTMGNLGAFITMNGKDLKPNFTTYEAVVSDVLQTFILLTLLILAKLLETLHG